MSEVTPSGTIDPNSFASDRELLRHIYREIQTMNTRMEQRERDYLDSKRSQDNRIDTNTGAIIELRTTIAERDKAFKTYLTIASVGVTVLSFLINLMMK